MTSSHFGPPVAISDIKDAAAALRARGLRLSAARRLVLEALLSAEHPVPAEEIAAGLGGRLPASDPASVYRNLEKLEELGLVRHMHLGHGPGLYILAGRNREYLVCESCRRVQAVEPSVLDPVRTAIRGRFGLEPHFTHFPIVGLCARCAGSREERTRKEGRCSD